MKTTERTNTESTTNCMYFTYNFPYRFIDKVWEDEPNLVRHFNDKFHGYCESHGSAEAVMRLFFDLSDHHKETLLNWVENNYSHKL